MLICFDSPRKKAAEDGEVQGHPSGECLEVAGERSDQWQVELRVLLTQGKY